MISGSLGSSRKFHELLGKAGNLGEFAQSLYPLIVSCTDDFGRIEGDPFTIKHKVFPTSPRSEAEFGIALRAMHNVRLVQLYIVEDLQCLQIVNFDPHQQGLHKRTKSRFPEVPADSRNFREIPAQENRIEENRIEHEDPIHVPISFTNTLLEGIPCDLSTNHGDLPKLAEYSWCEEAFNDAYQREKRMPYVAQNGDKKALLSLYRNIGPLYEADYLLALANFFRSARTHRLTDFCTNFAEYYNHKLDRFNRPVTPESQLSPRSSRNLAAREEALRQGPPK